MRDKFRSDLSMKIEKNEGVSISVRKYLNWSLGERFEAFYRMVQLLLEGIRIHAVEGDKSEWLMFRAYIESVEKKLERQTPPSEVLVLAGALVKALEHYNRYTTRLLNRLYEQLREMVGMLTQTLAKTVGESDRSMVSLKGIEKKLKNASMLEDILALKSNLEECLECVRQESVRRREESAKVITSLRQALKRSENRSTGAQAALQTSTLDDPLTGLPERTGAERDLTTALQTGRHTFAVVFCVAQLSTLKARFGSEVVDEIVVFVCQTISMGLPPEAALYRWSHPSFVAIFECNDSVAEVNENLRGAVPSRMKEFLNIQNREVLVTAKVSSKVLPIFEFAAAGDLIRAIDWSVMAGKRS